MIFRILFIPNRVSVSSATYIGSYPIKTGNE